MLLVAMFFCSLFNVNKIDILNVAYTHAEFVLKKFKSPFQGFDPVNPPQNTVLAIVYFRLMILSIE